MLAQVPVLPVHLGLPEWGAVLFASACIFAVLGGHLARDLRRWFGNRR